MSDSKAIRKAIRNVIQETGTDMLTSEVAAQIEKRVMAYVKERLDKIDERQKDITAFMIRQSVSNTSKG